MIRKEVSWQDVPNTPGVYFFMGKNSEILYIGKATSLRQRLSSYFAGDITEKRSVLIEAMVESAEKIEWMQTDSVLEAMLIETNLIRTHKPVCNTRSKDDKSFNHVIITKEEYPRVLVVRGKDLESYEYSHVYGPFPSGLLFKDALKIIRKLFQFYDVATPARAQHSAMQRGRIDFNRQIGLYPGECTSREYARTIKHIRLFFEGRKERIIADLEREMTGFAKKLEFERAQVLKKKIFALRHIQDVALLGRVAREYRDDRSMRFEAYDVAHMGGKDMVGVMVVNVGGEPVPDQYRKFIVKTCTDANDPKALGEILNRRILHTEWSMPDLIVVDGSTAQRNVAERALKEHGYVIPVIGVVKDEHHKPKHCIGPKNLIAKHEKNIMHANAEAHRFAITFHRSKRKIDNRK